MQPDNQNNYWKPEADEPTEMYTPDPASDTLAPTPTTETTSAPDSSPTKPSTDEPVHWQAEEYIHQDKNTLWFTVFGIVALAFIATDIFYLKSYTFSALVVVMAVAVIIYSRRPPKTIDYTLSGEQGLYVGEKLYHFGDFKAFGLIEDAGHHSISLIPTKRFAPGVTVYFPAEAGEKIVDILGARLPMEKLKLDIIDVIVRKLHL